jgi:hypothetical protein
MDTLIKFRQKVFGTKAREVVKFVKSPQGIISTTALTVSTANLATNASRHSNDKKYQMKQIDAMNDLTKSITGLDNTVKKSKKDGGISGFVGFRPKIKRQ